MLKKFRLGTKFTLILSLVFLGGILASGAILSQVLERRAEQEVSARGLVLIETMNSVRRYTSTQVNPLLAPDLATAAEFIPQSVPAFSAREVFETLRSNEAYQNYLYKEATLNPTNPRDLANEFEAALVEQFRAQPELTQLTGYTTLNGEYVFYSSRPLTISAESCLGCHSTPENAPASLITTYGTEGGFGWNLGDIIAAQTIYVPAEDVFSSARLSLTLVMGIIVAIFALVVIVTNTLLRRMVVRPVEQMARLARRIGADTLSPKAPELAAVERIANRYDELGRTATVFQKMAKEVYAREQKLKDEVLQLNIQIDEQKRTQQVQQITESDYFQDLQRKVKQLRDTPMEEEG
jgi:methyl-accepting chemotaxis protein